MDKNEVVETEEKNEEFVTTDTMFKLGKWRIGRVVDEGADSDTSDENDGKLRDKVKKIALGVAGIVVLGVVAGCALALSGGSDVEFEDDEHTFEDGFGDRIEVEAETVESVED